MIEQHQTLFKHNELPKHNTDTQCAITDARGNLHVNNAMCQQMKQKQEELQELNEKDKNEISHLKNETNLVETKNFGKTNEIRALLDEERSKNVSLTKELKRIEEEHGNTRSDFDKMHVEKNEAVEEIIKLK